MRLADTGRAVPLVARPTTLRHWLLDDPVLGSTYDVITGRAAAVFGTGSPWVVPACAGVARRFTTAIGGGLRESSADLVSRGALEGNWTATVVVRLTAPPAGTVCLLAFAGPQTDVATDPNNYLLAFRVDAARKPVLLWEYGGGTNVQIDAATYALPVGKWVALTWRKSGATGPGDTGGTAVVELLANGVRVPVTTGGGPVSPSVTVTNCSHGSAGVWRLGHEETSGGAATAFPPADLACATVAAEVLSNDTLLEDVRRLHLLPFHPRVDLRVDVANPSGVAVDLCHHEGLDWVDEVTIDDEQDQPCMTARVSLLREQAALGLAGLRTDTKVNLTNVLDPTSYAPLILEGRTVEVFGARVPVGLRASGADWVSVFRGTVDEVEEAGDSVVLSCRDDGGKLVDTFVEEVVTYGAPIPGVAVEGEMQWILNDNDNDPGNNSVAGLVLRTGAYAPLTLYTPTSPGWSVLEWKQRREAVLPALRTLAGQIGWECRYRWDASTASWRLTFYDPERGREDADVLLQPDDVLDVGQFQRSLLGARNVVRVIYPSSETSTPALDATRLAKLAAAGYVIRSDWNNLDGQDNRVTAWVELESPASIAAYGRRLFMEIAEDASSQVSTLLEAFDMAFGALSDLEEAPLGQSVTLPLLFEREVNDVVLFAPNLQLHTAQQRLAVRSISHTFGERCTSTVTLRGRPAVGWKRWLRLETRAGNARPGVQKPADANADQSQGSLLQAMRNLLDRSNAFRGGKFLALRNGDFQSFSNGLRNPPDGWLPRSSVWLTDLVSDTGAQSGNKAIRFLTAGAQLESDPVVIDGSHHTPYSVQVTWQRTAVSTYYPRIDVEFLDATKALLSTYTLEPVGTPIPAFQVVPTTAATWFTSRADGVRPPSSGLARFLRIVVRGSLTGTFVPFLVDDVAAYRTARELHTFTITQYGAVTAAANNRWYPCQLAAGAVYPFPLINRFDWGNNGFASGASPYNPSTVLLTGESVGTARGSGFYAREDGTYHVLATVAVKSSSGASNQFAALRLQKNATYNNPGLFSVGGTTLLQSQALELIASANFGHPGLVGGSAMVFNVSHRCLLARGDVVQVEFYKTNTNTNALGNAAGDLLRLHVKQELTQ